MATNEAVAAEGLQQQNQMDETTIKKIRPVNSFMLWRTYYSPMFDGIEQKERSGKLTILWSAEQNQSKWAILAQAYSMIRDSVGKDKADVSKFVRLMVPKIGIVHRDGYLDAMGWVVNITQNGATMNSLFVVNFLDFPVHIQRTSMTSNDVVEYCRQQGYFDQLGNSEAIIDSANGLMAAWATPANNANNKPKANAKATNGGIKKIVKQNGSASSLNIKAIQTISQSMGSITAHPFFNMTTPLAAPTRSVLPTIIGPFSAPVVTPAVPAIWDTTYDGIFSGTETTMSLDSMIDGNQWRVGELSDDNQFVNFLCGTVPDYSLPLFPNNAPLTYGISAFSSGY